MSFQKVVGRLAAHVRNILDGLAVMGAHRLRCQKPIAQVKLFWQTITSPKGQPGIITVEIQQRILIFVTRTNWILFVAATFMGFLLFPAGYARGIFFGGLLVTVNFHLLARTLRTALTPPHLSSHNVVIAKYFLRFITSGFIIFVLIAGHFVHPLGLIIGLSVVVFSIMLATLREFAKLIFKEAV